MGDEADRLSEWTEEADDLDDERLPRVKKSKVKRLDGTGRSGPRFPQEQPPGLAGIDRPWSAPERVRVAILFDDKSQGTFYTAFGDPDGKATDEEKAQMILADLQKPFIYVNMIVSPKGFDPVSWRQVMFATRSIESMWILHPAERDVDSRRQNYGR